MPLMFGYAILKHRVFDINFVVRRSLQYLLAKNGLRFLFLVPVAGLAFSVFSDPHRTLAEILFRNSIYFYIFGFLSLVLLFREKLSRFVDRRFFREVYDGEQILLHLPEEIRKLDSVADISRRVSQEVELALHPEKIYLFYRDDERGDFSLGYSSGIGETEGSERFQKIPERFTLPRLLETEGGARDFPFSPKTNLPPEETNWLRRLGANLIVPMSDADGRLSGLLVLGAKKSEESYTAKDRQLLEAVSNQIAVIYENLRLKSRAEKERRIKREVLARFERQNINLVKECPTCGVCFDSAEQICRADGSALVLSLPVERVIDGKYRLEKLVGAGGMGAVYQATDLRFNRKTAVKLMLGSMFGDPTALRRFRREAQAAARLNHPNIIAIHDFGQLEAGAAEGAYLVMEFVEGASLRDCLKLAGKIEPAAAELFDQILEGIKAAHQAGVLHRDLKPENILLNDESGMFRNDESGMTNDESNPKNSSFVKILDFGLAKFVAGEEAGETSNLTKTGAIMGAIAYMSPEQLEGEAADERSDIFSLGVMLVEILTGARPFQGRTSYELLRAMNKPFNFSFDSRLKPLDDILAKCLAKNRERRFSNVARMQTELIPALRGCPVLPIFEASQSDAS